MDSKNERNKRAISRWYQSNLMNQPIDAIHLKWQLFFVVSGRTFDLAKAIELQ